MLRRGRGNVLPFHGKSSLWSQEHASSYLRGVSHPAGSEGSVETGEHPPKRSVPCVNGGANGNPLQYSCLENLMDRGAWQATVYRVTKSQTRLSTHDASWSQVLPTRPCLWHNSPTLVEQSMFGCSVTLLNLALHLQLVSSPTGQGLLCRVLSHLVLVVNCPQMFIIFL